ncbi:hypothetical protein [Atlantibacter hermannii]|uniref:hypothetical protein n=1 Tax=Atlantibacter hermannii TaxID=565 RepID=UPI0028ADCC32|nr:hypothetical protein [Atlantibacter hermannii]
MKNKQAKTALNNYLRVSEEIKKQEREGMDGDPDGIGYGAEESLYDELEAARAEFCQSVTPSDYQELLTLMAKLRDNLGELILENMVLKSEVRRLGGDPDFIGNVDTSGEA